MTLNSNQSPATTELTAMIDHAIRLDRLCEAAYFTLRYLERTPQAKGSFFLNDPKTLKDLLTRLEQMRDLMPPGACDLISRTQDSSYNAFFTDDIRDVNSVFATLTDNGKILPETIVGRYKTNMDKFHKMAKELHSDLENLKSSGLETVSENIGQMVWSQGLEDLNHITQSTIFTYPNELKALRKSIDLVVEPQLTKSTEAQSARKEPFTIAAKEPSAKQKAKHEIQALFKTADNTLNITTHPAIVMEMIKKCIVTFELHNELRNTPPGARVIENMLSFMKNQCTPERFQQHLASINLHVNREMDLKIKAGAKFTKDKPYKIEEKYDDVILRKTNPSLK